MTSTIETGHSKNVSHFETLILACTGFGTVYNPSNSNLAIAALIAQQTQAKIAIKTVKTTEASFDAIEGQRKAQFEPLKSTATKVINALKAASVPATVLADAQTINRKLQGGRATSASQAVSTEEMPKDKNSVSQQSYDMQIDHFEKLIELVSIAPKYNPNEASLTVEALTAYQTALETINTAVKTVYIPYKTALQTRDTQLYAPEIGIVDTAKMVKNYVKSVFGATSLSYKQISKLLFRK